MDIEYKFNYKYNTESNRLSNYEYSGNGGYFITICTRDKINYFGKIINGEMVLNEYGEIIKKYLLEIQENFKDTIIDEFIIMPNHIHFNVFLQCREVHLWPLNNNDKKGGFSGNRNCMLNDSLGKIINWFKGRCTFEINKIIPEHFSWQSNYYDRIIRNEIELNKIRKYIIENPLKWELEKGNEIGIFM